MARRGNLFVINIDKAAGALARVGCGRPNGDAVRVDKLNSRQPRLLIFELDEKLTFLLSQGKKRGSGLPGTAKALAEAISVSQSLIAKVRSADEPDHYCLINPEIAQRIADIYDFSCDWPEWRDDDAMARHYHAPDSSRQDTGKAFAAKYLARGDTPPGARAPDRDELVQRSMQFPLDFVFRFALMKVQPAPLAHGRAIIAQFDTQPLYGDTEMDRLGELGLTAAHISLTHSGSGSFASAEYAMQPLRLEDDGLEVRFFGDDDAKGWWVKSLDRRPIVANVTLGAPYLFAFEGFDAKSVLTIRAALTEREFHFEPNDDFAGGRNSAAAEKRQTMIKNIIENLAEVGLSKIGHRYQIGIAEYQGVAPEGGS